MGLIDRDIYGVGQEFHIFTDKTKDFRSTGQLSTSHLGYLAYQTQIVLNLDKINLPINLDFVELGCGVDKALTPFDPEMGYIITPEDYNPQARIRKLISRMERYSKFIGPNTGLLEFRATSVVNIPSAHPLANPIRRREGLRLIVGANGQVIMGDSIREENKDVNFCAFYPAATGRGADLSDDRSPALKDLVTTVGWRSKQYQFIAATLPWFSLMVPDEPKTQHPRLRTVTARFVLPD